MGVMTPLRGKGITIAYVDSGFSMHPDTSDRVKLYVDATTTKARESKKVNYVDVMSWHGLMVSTIGSGDGTLSSGYYGSIAPESNLVLVKSSSPEGQIKEADILRGLQWLIHNHLKYRIRVVNVSLGGDHVSTDPTHPLHRAVRMLVNQGVAVVVASGNRGQSQLVPPASAPEAIVVGGYNDRNSANPDDWVGYHSNFGTAHDGTMKPDLVAPAEWLPSPILPETSVEREARWLGEMIGLPIDKSILRLLHRGYQDLKLTRQQVYREGTALFQDLQNRIFAHKLIDRYYQYVDGTSVAAPIVSAAIALMLEANPSLDVASIRFILRDTARPLASIDAKRQGAGALQVDEAVNMARRV